MTSNGQVYCRCRLRPRPAWALFSRTRRAGHLHVGAHRVWAGFAQSQRDLNADGFVDVIGDITLLTNAYSSQGGDPNNDGVGDGGVPGYQGRFDLNYDSFVDIVGDISRMTAVFGATC